MNKLIIAVKITNIKGASSKSKQLNLLYEKYCKQNNIIYVNNNDLQTGIDGVHLTLESHNLLSQRLANLLKV